MNEKEKLYCSHCGAAITNDDYYEVEGDIVCTECVENHTVICDHCHERVWDSNSVSDDYTTLCSDCFNGSYYRCGECDSIIHEDNSNYYDGDHYCDECYDRLTEDTRSIHDYSYKPEPIFYGDSDRYFGVELEIDMGGKEDSNAEAILHIANDLDERIYIKSDGSLDDGMEIVTHPMSLEYHEKFCWKEILRKAVSMGYRSHQTGTCGLHIHVNRRSFGDTHEAQEEVISRILYFVEHHWNELLTFSRRSEYTMNRWAARYGYEKTGREILDKAKKNGNGRYAAVNLLNYATIEFRLFRGTLKYNTLIAAIQLVNRICDLAVYMTDEGIQKLSWSAFVADITEPDLIRYLKERRLYVNDVFSNEEDM